MSGRLKSDERRGFMGGLAVGVAASVVLAGGVAVAAIPSTSTGLISGCRNIKTGALRVIDYQAGKRCTPTTERPLTWNAKGAAGPRGLQGIAGATGPQGSARGYARIDSTGTVTRSIAGITATHPIPGSGVYCVTVPGVDASTTVAIVAPDYSGDTTGLNGTQQAVAEFSSSSNCGANSFSVVTLNNNGGNVASHDESFAFMVP